MLKETRFTRKGFVVWGVCALFFLYEFFLRSSLGTFQHSLMRDLHLSSIQYSLLSSTLFLAMYGLMQIPVGLLIDNIGLKKSLVLGAALCTLSTFAFAHSTTFYWAIVSRMLMGVGASVGFLGLLVSVHEWMPHRYNALFIGLSQFIGTLGPMLGAGPLEDFVIAAGVTWQHVFKVLGFIGACVVFLIAVLVENSHETAEKYSVLRRPQKTRSSLLKLFSRSQAWYIAVFSATVYFSLEYLSENEGRIFLELKGFNPSFASYMMTIGWIGYAFGCPILGFLSDYFERRKSILIGASVCCIVALIGLVFSSNKYVIMLGFLLLGIAASGQSVGFAIIAEQFKKQFVAIGLALNNAMLTAFSAINAPLIGWALDGAQMKYGPSLTSYYLAFSVLIISGCAAFAMAFFFIKETFCKSVVDFNALQPKS